MKPGDLVCVKYDNKKKYYLVRGWNSELEYYVLIDTKTGEITTEYYFKVKLVCAS